MSGFIVYILVSIFTPGPNNVFSSISTVEKGFIKTIPFMIGIGIGTSLVFLSSAYLNNQILLHSGVYTVIGVLGGLLIIYLGYIMMIGRSSHHSVFTSDYLFIKAIFLNFINPKTLLFGITISVYYTKMDLDKSFLYGFMMLMGVLCFVAVIVWGLFGRLLEKLIRNNRQLYHITMGILLIYSGVLIIIESV